MQQYWKEWRRSPLLTAFLCSCLAHLLLFLLWKTGVLELPDRLVQFFVKRKVQVAEKQPPPPKLSPTNAPPVPKEIPLAFIEIDSEVATPQPPKDAKFYSSANSVAANPDPRKETPTPKADGKQDKIAKLRDVPRATLPAPPPPPPTPTPPAPAPAPAPPPAPAPAPPPKPEIAVQPTPQPPPPAPPPKPTPAPVPKEAPAPVVRGNTDAPKPPTEIAKADPPKAVVDPQPQRTPPVANPTPPAETPKPRVRNLAQARREAGLVGDRMKQDGGVRRAGKLSVDTRATLFGEYDAEFVRAVQERWLYLIDNSTVALRSGKVVLQFNLRFDGAISDMVVKETEVGDTPAYLCQRAVTDPSPYPKWSQDMHKTVGANFRVMVFTFLYY